MFSNIDPRIIKNIPFSHPRNIAAVGYVGSVSHGTHVPKPGTIDDTDVLGVIIPPARYLIGLQQFEQWDPRPDENSQLGELDCTFYDIRKMIKLLLKNNPNVMAFLWLKSYVYVENMFSWFIDNRELFNSIKAYPALRGYALGQMKDIDKAVYRGYMGAKRKAMVDKLGYDPKHASHTIRLLKMGREYLDTGQYNVDRTGIDADELIDIKQGNWKRDSILRYADKLLVELDEAAGTTSLPLNPQTEIIEEALMNILLWAIEDEMRTV